MRTWRVVSEFFAWNGMLILAWVMGILTVLLLAAAIRLAFVPRLEWALT